MKRLILGNPSGLDLKRAGLGDAVLPLSFRFAWGVLPSPRRLSLTDFGQEVSDRELDFSQYNPIHSWWGGTELTNERLWRWDAESRTLVAP